jgi:hypothetical protein
MPTSPPVALGELLAQRVFFPPSAVGRPNAQRHHNDMNLDQA